MDLSDNSLTGDIPEELGWLYNLDEVRLSGNILAACLPVDLEEAATNDLATLNLPYCQPPPPDNVMVGTPGENSVVVSWDAVPNTSKYQVEYYNEWLGDWVVDDDTITGTTHTVDGLHCGRRHWFQVRAYGSGDHLCRRLERAVHLLAGDHIRVCDPGVRRGVLRLQRDRRRVGGRRGWQGLGHQ